jgi:hypothetical protein
MSGSLNDRQKMFLLAFLSELGSGLVGTGIGSILHYVIQQQFARLAPSLGQWELIWGPAYFQLDAVGPADSVMFVASSQADRQLVVAIAGTNPNSIFDWFVLDWDVGKAIRWPYGSPPADAAVAEGSWLGLQILRALKPGYGVPGTGTTLGEFLTVAMRALNQQVTLNVTGHSLGGALSPALALWLLDTQSFWDPRGLATVMSYAYAGPTTGNAAFAEYGKARLGPRFHRIANSLDLSPLGWATASLEKCKSIYAPVIPSDALVVEEINYRIQQTNLINYQQIDPGAEPLPGKINTALLSPYAPYYVSYHAQADYQHTDAYFDLLGVPQYLNYQWLIRSALRPLAVGSAAMQLYLFLMRRYLSGVSEARRSASPAWAEAAAPAGLETLRPPQAAQAPAAING